MPTSATYRVPAAPRPSIPNDPLYQTPQVAWSTLLLFVVSLARWIATFAGGITALLPPWLAIALLTIAAFMLFTVLHDGVHRSLLRGYPLVNEIIATIAGASLGPAVTGAAFRYVHFSHHRNTNDLAKDPDSWSGIGPRLRMPLQWATVDFMYVVVIVREWSQIPRAQKSQIVIVTGGLLAAYAASWPRGRGPAQTMYWLLPSRVALPWLAFAFNFLPHHPHDVPQSHNPYAATNVRLGGEPLMKWLFLYQNYHVIHHLLPSVPFYRYLRIWNARREEFMRLGTAEVPLLALE